jgi:TPR repeat protein
MTRIKILFFAADPLSAPSYGTAPRLMLDEDIRRIREKVRAAEHRDSLDFDYHLAARTDDLRQALQEKHPQVVHFSGHGGREGLVFVSPDGQRPHRVDAEALTWAFQAYSGDIRVVVLNACYSLPQAEAIAGVVGCAIGTTHAISDAAAITFASSFYSAVAFGDSVQAAFDKARAALAMDHFDERETPQLVTRDGVDAAGLVLVHPAEKAARSPWLDLRRWGARQATVAATVLAVSTGAVFEYASGADEAAQSQVARRTLISQSSPAEAVTAGRELYQAGNYDAAFLLFDRAAKDGNAEAMGFLAIAYRKGQGTSRQPQLGRLWLHRAAKEKRDPRAMNELGAAYEQGEGENQSYHYAMIWYVNAVEEGDWAPAMANIGDMFRHGLGEPPNYATALAWYQKASDAGYADAMVDIGSMYEEGLGQHRDLEKARRLYRDAADRGSARGMVEMGRIHRDGVGVPQDYAQARAWFQKGVDARSAEAMNNMGVLYHNGWGVPRDRDAAVHWFRRAAEAGSAVAAGNLAAM